MATPFLMVLSRNIASPVFVAVTVLLVACAWKDKGWDILWQSLVRIATSKAAVICFLLVLCMVASILWTTSVQRGIDSTLHLSGNLLLFALSLSAFAVLEPSRRLNRVVLPAVLIATAGFVVSEIYFQAPIRGLLGGASEAFRMNRAAVAIVLFLPLALVCLKSGQAAVMRAASVLVVGVAAFSSESESAQLAFMVTLVSFPIFWLLKRNGTWVLGSLVLASFVLMPLMVPHVMSLVPDAIEQHLPYGSVGIRADIWTAHASLLHNAPLLGHGVDASLMAAEDYKHTDIPELFLRWGHPHNFAMQVWYELGALGVALIAALIFLFFRGLKTVPVRVLPALLSTITAVWTVAVVSHGAWQAWWWCLLGLLSLLWLIELKSRQETVEATGES
ncbi:O-antigen ligase [Labrenzia sp. PHM005]|uniref:O-antigen ligase family protein n=1 Tax=Labrenzia sp. PHM005 TaxID=2590016 RepID=UPI00143D61A2|nr:O-antigen ligase family protein [Labrenzia sp. PHM005]